MTATPLMPSPAFPSPQATSTGEDETGGGTVPSPAGQIDAKLVALLSSLLEMGICASDVQPTALESNPAGPVSGFPGGLIGRKVSQSVEHLASLYDLRNTVSDIMIPLEVINAVDAGKNPHQFTKDLVERVAGENMYTHGILKSVADYRDLLGAEMADKFPELADLLAEGQHQHQTLNKSATHANGSNGVANGNGRLDSDAMQLGP